MKGIVFTVFNRLVEEKFGLEMWNSIIEATSPSSGGAYTSADTYEDQELYRLVGALSERTGVPANDLIFTFGEFMLMSLRERFPVFFKDHTLKTFLESIDGVIHVEVKKLYPDAGLPKFDSEEQGPERVVLIYRSERKLCRLAEGLIHGSAKHFKNAINIHHPICMHTGYDHCRIEVEIEHKEEQ